MLKKTPHIRVGVVGAGSFGSTFIGQARRVPRLRVDLICDSNVDRARSSLLASGYDGQAIKQCDNRSSILQAIEGGSVAVIGDAALLRDLPLDVVLEATGEPSIAASIAEMAISSGYGIAMATKETEVVIGSELAYQARRAGLGHLPVEGDQPALLINLVARARLLGLPVVAAGKSTESDFIYDQASRTVSCWGRTVPVSGYEELFEGGSNLTDILSQRQVPGLAVATPPDLCEMTIVANHCNLSPSTPSLHAPIARTVELAQIFSPYESGGILEMSGAVDVFGCLRRPEELSFAGGVFVTVEVTDSEVGSFLASKGIPGSRDGKYLLLHNPIHLLGVEAIASILAVADPPASSETYPDQRYDMVARAERDVAAGELFGLGERHEVDHVAAEIQGAAPLSPDNAVPYYLVARSRAVRPIAKGALITGSDIAFQEDNALLKLRRAQDGRMRSAF